MTSLLLLFVTFDFTLLPRLSAPSDEVADAYKAAGECSTWSSAPARTFLARDGQVVCFSGEITRVSGDAFLQTPIADNAIVVLNSLGGDPLAAIDMAEHLEPHNVTIVVDQNCISACANYLFMVGKRKFVLKDAFLGFHGSFIKDSAHFIYEAPDQLHAEAVMLGERMLEKILDHDAKFYARLGITKDVINNPPGGIDIKSTDLNQAFWEFGPNSLRVLSGVTGVRYFSTPDRRTLTASFIDWLGGPHCKKAGADAWLCKSMG